MILFQKNGFNFNTGLICALLIEMLGGSCEAVNFSQSMIFLEKVACPVPRHLRTKSAYMCVMVVLLIVNSGRCYNF